MGDVQMFHCVFYIHGQTFFRTPLFPSEYGRVLHCGAHCYTRHGSLRDWHVLPGSNCPHQKIDPERRLFQQYDERMPDHTFPRYRYLEATRHSLNTSVSQPCGTAAKRGNDSVLYSHSYTDASSGKPQPFWPCIRGILSQ